MKGEEEGLGGYAGQPGGGGGQDGQIPLSLFGHLSPSPAAHASRFFPREEVEQAHCKDTQEHNNVNCVEAPITPDHMQLENCF